MNKKVNRLIKSYRSIQMNNEVQDYIVNNDDRFDDNYILMAKKIIQKMRIMPTYERYYDLAQKIKNGEFNDLPVFNNDNIDLYVNRAEQILKNKKILLSNKTYTFDELKEKQINHDYYFFDDDPKYKNSKFILINILLSNIKDIFLSKNDKEMIECYLENGYCENEFFEEVGEIIKLIKDNINLEPIIINKNNYVIDGFHRVCVYLYLGYTNIDVYKEI